MNQNINTSEFPTATTYEALPTGVEFRLLTSESGDTYIPNVFTYAKRGRVATTKIYTERGLKTVRVTIPNDAVVIPAADAHYEYREDASGVRSFKQIGRAPTPCVTQWRREMATITKIVATHRAIATTSDGSIAEIFRKSTDAKFQPGEIIALELNPAGAWGEADANYK